MRSFKTRVFVQFAQSVNLTDASLWRAALEIESGLVDAKLGGNLYKKRIAISGRGKRSGARALVIYRKDTEWILFIYGFPKNKIDNITVKELGILREFDEEVKRLTNDQIKCWLQDGKLQEIADENANTQNFK